MAAVSAIICIFKDFTVIWVEFRKMKPFTAEWAFLHQEILLFRIIAHPMSPIGSLWDEYFLLDLVSGIFKKSLDSILKGFRLHIGIVNVI